MVFYFTGTGNSLYLAKRIEENPISIPQVIGQVSLEYTADTIGIVAPVYGHEVPAMVREFLKRAVFHTDYFYLILTYGNRHGGAAELAKKLCDECGIAVSYINVILMVDNWLPAFDMDEQRRVDKKVEEHLEEILSDLAARRKMISAVTDADRAAHQEFLARMSRLPADAWQHLLRVTDACTGCGICEKVCPSSSIHVADGRAVHTPGNCQTCLACVHACPSKAIGLTVPEKNPNARYRNEHVTLRELMEANGQGKRPYTICHILSSVNGKITGAFMRTGSVREVSREYGCIRTEYQADAWLYGTITTKEFTQWRTPQLDPAAQAPDGDYVAQGNAALYYISVDTLGEIGWESGTFHKEGRPDSHVIEVLTEQTPAAYRAYLREHKVSYIIAGSGTLDCKIAEEKLYRLFGIRKILICGGGTINWTFLQQGVVDELSLLIAPAADGGPAVSVFERSPLLPEGGPAEFGLKDVERLEGNGVRLVYTVKRI